MFFIICSLWSLGFVARSVPLQIVGQLVWGKTENGKCQKHIVYDLTCPGPGPGEFFISTGRSKGTHREIIGKSWGIHRKIILTFFLHFLLFYCIFMEIIGFELRGFILLWFGIIVFDLLMGETKNPNVNDLGIFGRVQTSPKPIIFFWRHQDT